jgi:hypothetical protein
VRWDAHPAASPVLMRTDSPLAVSALLLRLRADTPRIIVTELSGGVDGQCLRWPDGGRHLAELAVSWVDDSYFEESGQGGG